MEEYLKVPGTTTKWKDKVYSHGQMAEDMKVTTKMIKKRATVFSIGQMAGNTMEAGKMENSMAWVHTPQPCLLYTSPSPRDLSTSRMPSSA